MAFPVPIITGTIAFIILHVLGAGFGLYLYNSKKLSKDNAQIYCISVMVCFVCTWIMWLCAWLHQWNPIIIPTETLTNVIVESKGGVVVGH
jgi:V-type H+-transporting ATPase subunit e